MQPKVQEYLTLYADFEKQGEALFLRLDKSGSMFDALVPTTQDAIKSANTTVADEALPSRIAPTSWSCDGQMGEAALRGLCKF